MQVITLPWREGGLSVFRCYNSLFSPGGRATSITTSVTHYSSLEGGLSVLICYNPLLSPGGREGCLSSDVTTHYSPLEGGLSVLRCYNSLLFPGGRAVCPSMLQLITLPWREGCLSSHVTTHYSSLEGRFSILRCYNSEYSPLEGRKAVCPQMLQLNTLPCREGYLSSDVTTHYSPLEGGLSVLRCYNSLLSPGGRAVCPLMLQLITLPWREGCLSSDVTTHYSPLEGGRDGCLFSDSTSQLEVRHHPSLVTYHTFSSTAVLVVFLQHFS